MGTSWAARSRARRRRVAPWEPSVLPRELRRKLGKVGKSLQSAPCSSRYFSRGLIVGSAARRSVAFLVWWPLLALSHPLFHGAVARRALLHCHSMFTGEVSEIASRLGPSAPRGAPAPCAPSLSLPAPHTSAPNFAAGVLPAPPSSAPLGSPSLVPGGPPAPLQPPHPSLAPLCPPLPKTPFTRAAEPRSLQRASQRDGWEWGWGT